LASWAGTQKAAQTVPFTFCPPKFVESVAPACFEFSRTNVWVLNGYWYPRLTVLPEVRLNSNFVFGTGWWAENGA
jgi:hypothetical protein